MLDRIREIAPLETWAQVLLAAALLLGAFVAYGHWRVLTSAFGEPAGGLAAADRPASMRRWAVLLLAAGLALWGLAIGWPPLATGALGAAAFLLLALDLAARLRA